MYRVNVSKLCKEIALDIAQKVENMGEGEIESHYALMKDSYQIEFRHPISLDLQGEMIEEAEARLAKGVPNSDWEFYAGFDDGPKYFDVVAVYIAY